MLVGASVFDGLSAVRFAVVTANTYHMSPGGVPRPGLADGKRYQVSVNLEGCLSDVRYSSWMLDCLNL